MGDFLPHPLPVNDEQQQQRQRWAEVSKYAHEDMKNKASHFEVYPFNFLWWRGGVPRRGLGHGL